MTDLQGLVDIWVEEAIEGFLDELEELEDVGYTNEEISRALLFHNQFWTAWSRRVSNA